MSVRLVSTQRESILGRTSGVAARRGDLPPGTRLRATPDISLRRVYDTPRAAQSSPQTSLPTKCLANYTQQ